MSGTSTFLKENKAVLEILTAEGREDFVKYIQALGLDKDPDLIFLSSQHYYFYDAEEMKNVKTDQADKEFSSFYFPYSSTKKQSDRMLCGQ
jgi:hypothetical protein